MRTAIFPRIGASLLALAACAEADEILAPLGELCGVEGPVRVLELAPDQAVIYRSDRIGELGRPSGSASHPFIPVSDLQLWTTGLCGEAPTRLNEQYSVVFEIERWPGLALACDRDDNLVSLSATGPLAPHRVFIGTGCAPVWSAHGPISRFDEVQPILHPYPDDPRSETAPWIPLPVLAQTGGIMPRIVAAGDELFVLRPEQELVSVDLRNGAVTLEQPGVGAFMVSPSGRYFLWTPDETGSPAAILHDRETGQGVFLGEFSLSYNRQALDHADQGLVVVQLANNYEQRIYRLPGLDFVALPPDHFVVGPLADGRWLVTRYQNSSFHAVDLSTGTVTPIFDRPGQVLAREPEGLVVLGLYRCCEFSRADDEGPVWFIPLDGSPPARIAARSTLFGWHPRPDSLITLVDIGSDRRARLVRVDTATQAEQLVDDHVFAAYIEDDADPDIIRYSVQDGERSGVWQVRLPP